MTSTITEVTESDLLDMWRAVNDNGDGYATEAEDLTEAKKEFTSVIDINSEGAFVGVDESGAIIVVADSNGAWACDVTELI